MTKDVLNKDFSPLKQKKLFLLDMDGTIYLENHLFEGVDNLLKQISSNGGKYVFITNNSSRSVKDYVAKLNKLGLSYVTENDFLTSTQVSKALLKQKFNKGLIYAQGTKSFISELKESGLNITEKFDENAVAVIVGFDTELTSEKLRNTCEILTKKDIPYYATNPDWVCPTEYGYVPDCGSVSTMLYNATKRLPKFIGKPEPTMVELAVEKTGFSKEETILLAISV